MKEVKIVTFTDETAEETLNSLEELKSTTEEKEIEEMFTFTPEKVEEIPQEVKYVMVIPTRDYPCSYGGQKYFFKKDKKQNVPVGLRDFLLKNKVNPKIKDTW